MRNPVLRIEGQITFPVPKRPIYSECEGRSASAYKGGIWGPKYPLLLLSPGNTHFPVTVMFKALTILHHFRQLFQILACLFETDSIMVTLLGAEVKWLLLSSLGKTHFPVTVMFKALAILHHFRQLF